jgi:hypothetical protein
MAELCREFGISRTGYKIFDRYQEMRSSRADRQEPAYANQLPFQVENYILNVGAIKRPALTHRQGWFLSFLIARLG